MSRKFLPTLDQVKRASEELPDPMTHDSDNCSVTVTSKTEGQSDRELQFMRMKFAAGKGKNIYRWVYDGKVMIRNSDINNKSRKKDKSDETVIFSLSVR